MNDGEKRGGSDEAQRDEENFRRETGIDFSVITRQEEQGLRRILFVNLGDAELAANAGQNTFRAGLKWSDLLISEQVEIALTANDEREETVIGTAVVNGVVTGELGTLLKGHAATNHGVVAAGVEPRKAFDTLLDILRGIYGADVPLDAQFTAVYLDRV